MNKIYYIIALIDTEDPNYSYAATPLLESEEEAYKMIGDVLEDVLEGVDYESEGFAIPLAVEFFEESGYVDLVDIGIRETLKLMEIEVADPDELKDMNPFQRHHQWLDGFDGYLRENIAYLGLRKRDGWYPKDFTVGALVMNGGYDPCWVMRTLGFEDMIFPIVWDLFFSNGRYSFKDSSDNRIEFSFSLDKEKWGLDVTVKVNEDTRHTSFLFDVDRCKSESQRMKVASSQLGEACMMLLNSIHPECMDED